MDMRIDAAWHHDLPGRIDDPRSADVREASGSTDGGNLAAADADIDRFRAARHNRFAARNNQIEHGVHSLLIRLRPQPPGPCRNAVSAALLCAGDSVA